MNTSGHTVLITGGASGIGLALTEQFIRNGNKVIVAGRNESKLSELKARYPDVQVILCDISRDSDRSRLVKWLNDEHSDLSVLVNNAGIQYNYAFTGENIQEAERKIKEETDINLITPIMLIAQLLPLLSRHPQAAIVNISSALGIVPKKSAPVYCATKAGLHLFTKALRYQLESTPIQVFEVIPPLVDTDMTKGRGRGKISAEQLAAEFWRAYRCDRLEISIGKVKMLHWLNRFTPRVAEAILKNS
ncbi:SDR family oxidoreductase [Paenibacillus sp. NPDC058071]|uniref:SDR family oxidoreductase n=1 Tax=Paenibacillus sp. NPDC058071 TaxID=3346326 RepID=UPI0036DA526D